MSKVTYRRTESGALEEVSGKALDDLPVGTLKKKAAEADIEGRSQMSKEELVEALEDAES